MKAEANYAVVLESLYIYSLGFYEDSNSIRWGGETTLPPQLASWLSLYYTGIITCFMVAKMQVFSHSLNSNFAELLSLVSF